jgi:hypothetical protein
MPAVKKVADAPAVGPYAHQEYPKFLYRGSQSKLVNSVEEHEALGADWVESPADTEPDVPAAALAGDQAALVAALEAANKENQRLRDELGSGKGKKSKEK